MPLDDTIGISQMQYKMTKLCMTEVAYYGQNQASFYAGSQMIKKTMNLYVNEETVRVVTEHIGKAVFDEDTKISKQALENIAKTEVAVSPKPLTLYIMTDGAAVNTRVEDVNGSTWRENKTVMVFTDRDLIKRKDGSHIIAKKEYSAFIGKAEDFRKYVWNLAIRHGYGKVSRVVLIADGAIWIRNMCNELFPDAIQILDLYHLKENVYTYAKYKFKQDASKYTPWAESINDKLEKGRYEEVITSLPKDEILPTNVVNLRTYLENNRGKTDYPAYKKQGLFVGSGAIESANKTILQRRLKQSGMRWSVPGAQYILSLRCKVESGLWSALVQRFCA